MIQKIFIKIYWAIEDKMSSNTFAIFSTDCHLHSCSTDQNHLRNFFKSSFKDHSSMYKSCVPWTSDGKLLDSLSWNESVAGLCSVKFHVAYCCDPEWKLPPPLFQYIFSPNLQIVKRSHLKLLFLLCSPKGEHIVTTLSVIHSRDHSRIILWLRGLGGDVV
jgi:hypothetical protein